MLDFDQHTFQAGIRFDNRNIETERHQTEQVFEAINRSFNSFTASLGYKTILFNAITTRLNLATGYRAPNLAELTSNGVHEGTNRFEIGNANLTNEQNYQIDLALEYKNEHIEFYANGFYNTINNYIFITPTGTVINDTNVFQYLQDNASLYGGEFGFHWHPHPLDWLHFESSFETVTGRQNNDDYLPLIPANQWNNTLRTEFKDKQWLKNGYASLKLESSFSQNNTSVFETNSDAYSLIHIALGGKIILNKTKFKINLNINNVFDTAYIAHLSRLKTDGIQNIGRNIVLGLNFDI
jgi:iron complex outermembrane receptor protein